MTKETFLEEMGNATQRAARQLPVVCTNFGKPFYVEVPEQDRDGGIRAEKIVLALIEQFEDSAGLRYDIERYYYNSPDAEMVVAYKGGEYAIQGVYHKQNNVLKEEHFFECVLIDLFGLPKEQV